MNSIPRFVARHVSNPIWDYIRAQTSAPRHAWTKGEKFWFAVCALLILTVAVFPGLVAEFAGWEIAPRWLISMWRSLNVVLALYVIFYVQRVPKMQKVILTCFILSMEGNLARNMFELQPLTVSYAFGLLGILLSSFRIMSRPTVYEMAENQAKENVVLKAENKELKDQLAAMAANNRGRRATDNHF